jgi:hypothetical protein
VHDNIEAINSLQPKLSQYMCSLSRHLFKNFIQILANLLAHVFTLSLQTGCVPVQIKTADITLTDSDSDLNTLFSHVNAELYKVVYFFHAHKLACIQTKQN